MIRVSVTCNRRSLDEYSPYLIIKEFVDPKEVERKGEGGGTGLESGGNIYETNQVGNLMTT